MVARLTRSSRRSKALYAVLGAGFVVLLVGVAALFVQQQSYLTEVSEGHTTFAPSPESEQPTVRAVLWVGDSFTVGTGSETPSKSYARIVSRELGLLPRVDAQGGSGFLADGKKAVISNVPVPERLDLNKQVFTPDLVIIDAGRNDGLATEAEVRDVSNQYLDDVREAWPSAHLVLIVPFVLGAEKPDALFADIYEQRASDLGATVINPVKEGWVGPKNLDSWIYKDGIHPNVEGHQYIADQLVERLQKVPEVHKS